MDILGIGIDDRSRDGIRSEISGFLRGDRFRRIATVNPEFIVEADRNPAFLNALRSADLRVADGVGIVLAGLFLGRRIHRYPGADLMECLLAEAEREGFGVFLAIRKGGLSSYGEARESLLRRHPKLVIGGDDFETYHVSEYLIHDTRYRILFCNFGAPEQEIFLESLRGNVGDIRIAMGVGGAFDYLTGKKKRAPGWMRAVGLEWFWRLLLQPGRIVRIWNATVVFLWKVAFRRKKAPV